MKGRAYSAEQRAALREYARNNAQANRGYVDRWTEKHPQERRAQWRASQAVQTAMRRGTLVRPEFCEWCGQRGQRIEAAHEDYARPLDVRWLCASCHRFWDKQNPKLVKPAS